MKLYDFQAEALKELEGGKKFLISGTGCLAKGTPIPLADGSIKNVEDIQSGDVLISYDEDTRGFIQNEVSSVIRTGHKPKPMIELSYGKDNFTTTYDHPFFNGDRYYPLYQLIWGALETSQRVYLKLLCEQYGQAFDNTLSWCKEGRSNTPCAGCQWLLPDSAEHENSEGSQNSSGSMAGQPFQLAMCEPFELRQKRQPSRELGMVYTKVQRMVGYQAGDNETAGGTQQPSVERGATQTGERVLPQEYGNANEQLREETTLRQTAQDVSECITGYNNGVGSRLRFEIKVSEPYYTISMRRAPYTYCIGREHYFVTHNSGKGSVMLHWLRSTGKKKWLMVTTASKRDSHDIEDECDAWFGNEFRTSLSSFCVVSWAGLVKWAEQNWADVPNWAIAFDEIHAVKAGISSNRGRAFLQLTKRTQDWTGYTATPAENWMGYYPYFTACGFVRNKTEFKRRFVNEQHFKGFPEIVGYRDEDTLRSWWSEVSYSPDTSEMEAQLPAATHKTVYFKKPKGYDKVIKNSETLEGEFIDSAPALGHYVRRMCGSAEKLQWLLEFVEGLSGSCVVFYNYIAEGDMIAEALEKKKVKVWRIDGKHHDIPTAETIGKHDVVLAQWTSGSASLNLQFLNYWVSFTPYYGYIVSIQARGRVRRIGQQKPQFYYYLKCRDTIEDDVYKALRNKQDFSIDNWSPRKES